MDKRFLPFVFILLLILVTRLFFFFNERHIYHENETFNSTYNFSHEPKENAFGQYFFVDNVLVTLPIYPKYNYGDKVLISGKIEKIKTKSGELLAVKNPTVTKEKENSIFLAVSRAIRQRVKDAVLVVLPPKEGGLLLGIILGVRDKIDNDFYNVLKNAGVLHVVAASGENVSIIAALLLLVFERIVKRRLALLFTSVVVVFYAFLTGFDPSIIRASIMALITFSSLALGKQSNALYALFMTGWAMVVFDPSQIIGTSFQLSFLSTFGILTVKPLIDRLFNFSLLSFIKDDITTTFAAQVGTFPVMLITFGSYSLLTFPVNILVLWTVPIIMIFGGLGAVLAIFSKALALPFILLSYPFLKYFVSIVEFSNNFNLSFSLPNLPISLTIGYYLILLAIVFRFKTPKGGKI